MNWQKAITDARARAGNHLVQTPVITTGGFGLDRGISLKLEHMQHTGSFKARGAFATLTGVEVPPGGVVAASGGNHGAAVGYAAAQLGHRAAIFVPEAAGPAKIALIERTGADLQVVQGAYSDALDAARAHEARTGAMQVHAYDAELTVAGQGTCFLEWEDQGLDADTVLIAVGGGGLIAGAMAWFAGRRKVVAVEPRACATLHSALAEGRPVDVDVGGLAVNALGARRIGRISFDLARAQGIEAVLVGDDDIALAQKALWQERRILAEPAGATALAALMAGAYQPDPGEKIAVMVCGGNIAPDPMQHQNG